MKKKEKQYILSLFLEQNENDYDMVHFAKEGFGITVFYTGSKVTQYKSMFDAEAKQIYINGLTTDNDEARFLVSYHIAEYILKDDIKISIIGINNMDADVCRLAQQIYQKSENIKNKQLKKGK